MPTSALSYLRWFLWADVGIGPYGASRTILYVPLFKPKLTAMASLTIAI